MRVLVVDDNDDLRRLMCSALSFAGHRVSEAESGDQAQALLQGDDEMPDAIVLDVQMPVMDGWATLDAIRNGGRTAEIPVVMCTVKSRTDDIVRGFEAGCDGYLVKPFDIDGFVATVERTVARDPQARAEYRKQMLAELREMAR